MRSLGKAEPDNLFTLALQAVRINALSLIAQPVCLALCLWHRFCKVVGTLKMELHQLRCATRGFLRLAAKSVTSRWVKTPTPEKSHPQRQHHHYYDQEQFGPKMTEIQGPPEAVTLWDKQRRIVGIIVKNACRPVPIIITETRTRLDTLFFFCYSISDHW